MFFPQFSRSNWIGLIGLGSRALRLPHPGHTANDRDGFGRGLIEPALFPLGESDDIPRQKR